MVSIYLKVQYLSYIGSLHWWRFRLPDRKLHFPITKHGVFHDIKQLPCFYRVVCLSKVVAVVDIVSSFAFLRVLTYQLFQSEIIIFILVASNKDTSQQILVNLRNVGTLSRRSKVKLYTWPKSTYFLPNVRWQSLRAVMLHDPIIFISHQMQWKEFTWLSHSDNRKLIKIKCMTVFSEIDLW